MQGLKRTIFAVITLYISIFLTSCSAGSNSSGITATPTNAQADLRPVAADRYAYITNYDDPRLAKCIIDNSEQLFGCEKFILNLPNDPLLRGVAIAPSGKHIYISTSDSKIYVCTINADGTLSGCQPKTDSSITSPTFMAVNLVTQKLYVSNEKGNSVVVCDITASSELLGTCNNAATGFVAPRGIAISKNGANAYIANSSGQALSICTILANGKFSSPCTNYKPPQETAFTEPSGVAVDPNGRYVYVMDSNSKLSAKTCTLAGSQISGCAGGKISADYDGADGISLNSTGKNAYVTIPSINAVFTCKINDGKFTCQTTAEGFFVKPDAIATT